MFSGATVASNEVRPQFEYLDISNVLSKTEWVDVALQATAVDQSCVWCSIRLAIGL